jgi:TM2 domain-containing membrane protein YozV
MSQNPASSRPAPPLPVVASPVVNAPAYAPPVGLQLGADARTMMAYDVAKKSAVVAYVLWWFLGPFGGHRFYLGKTGSAAAMLIITLVSIPLVLVLIGILTIWITVIWALVDAFLIPGMIREHNARLASSLIMHR